MATRRRARARAHRRDVRVREHTKRGVRVREHIERGVHAREHTEREVCASTQREADMCMPAHGGIIHSRAKPGRTQMLPHQRMDAQITDIQ